MKTHRLTLFILGTWLIYTGCTTHEKDVNNAPAARIGIVSVPDIETVPWRWECYSNRTWLEVSGVGVEVGRSNLLRRLSFSYSVNTGRSKDEAVAIRAYNVVSGGMAELFLLRSLYGTGNAPFIYSTQVSDGRAFHIYSYRTGTGRTNTVFFDATHYHSVF